MVSNTPALDYWISRTFCSILDTTCQVTDKSMPSGREDEGQDETRRLAHAADRRLMVSWQTPEGLPRMDTSFSLPAFQDRGSSCSRGWPHTGTGALASVSQTCWITGMCHHTRSGKSMSSEHRHQRGRLKLPAGR